MEGRDLEPAPSPPDYVALTGEDPLFEKVNQYYVPQFWQRRFKDTDDKLWVRYSLRADPRDLRDPAGESVEPVPIAIDAGEDPGACRLQERSQAASDGSSRED